MTETFSATQQVRGLTGQGGPSQPEPSGLRGSGATPAAKRCGSASPGVVRPGTDGGLVDDMEQIRLELGGGYPLG